MATKKKTVRLRCVAPEGCLVTRAWSDQKQLRLEKNDTVDVPVGPAEYLASLTYFQKAPKNARKPKPEHTEKAPAEKAPSKTKE